MLAVDCVTANAWIITDSRHYRQREGALKNLYPIVLLWIRHEIRY